MHLLGSPHDTKIKNTPNKRLELKSRQVNKQKNPENIETLHYHASPAGI